MLRLKKLYKAFMPPIFDHQFRFRLKQLMNQGGYFSGPYIDWEHAKKNAAGYDNLEIIKKIRKTTLLQKKDNIFVRDGIAFDKPDHSYPLLTALLSLLLIKSEINLIDFGGGLGSTYYNCKKFIENENYKINWHIVEQPHFIEIGRTEHQTEELSFYDNIDLIKPKIDMLILSAVLQYLSNPIEFITNFKNKKYPYIFIDRSICHFNPYQATSIMVEHVPKHIYKASYPCYIFNYQKLLEFFTEKYDIVYEFNANEGRQNLGNIDVLYKGVLLKLK